MKVGDLVKHPAGIKNVSKEQYSMGVGLHMMYPKDPRGETQAEVWWHGADHGLLYHTSQLEVISENR